MVYSIQDILYLWESYGLFDYIFPFLLVFAVVYGILISMHMFERNRSISLIISIVIGFMAIRFGWFSQFYAELFPRLGIGITIMLAIMIMIGLFVEKEYARYWLYGLSAVAGIIALLIVYQSFSNLGWVSGFNGEIIGWIVLGALFLTIIIAIASAGNPKPNTTNSSVIIPGFNFTGGRQP